MLINYLIYYKKIILKQYYHKLKNFKIRYIYFNKINTFNNQKIL